MGSKQRVRGRRDLRDRGKGGSGRRFNEGAEGGTKGHVGMEKRIGMGSFAAALPHLVPRLLLVGQQHHLRQKLVEGAPQTVAVAHER
eukprot:3597265-Prymnesium_polylepis.1